MSPPVSRPKSDFVFDYSKANWKDMNDYLLDCDFSVCYESDDVEEIWAAFKLLVSDAVSIFVPKVRLSKNQSPKWFTAKLRHKSNCVNSLAKRTGKSPTKYKLEKLAAARRELSHDIEQAKSTFEKNHLSVSNCSNIYKYIRSIKAGGPIPSFVSDGNIRATFDAEKAALFNSYFHSVFTVSDYPLPLPSVPSEIESCLDYIEFDFVDVYTAMASLDPSKAMGIDGLGPGILKYCSSALCEPLHHLFSVSIQKKTLPDEWKVHTISPIYKSGDRSLVANYRPISLLCSVSKVLEKLVYCRIIDFLSSRLSNSQFGFLPGRSCLQQLLTFYSDIFSSTSSKCHFSRFF